MAHPEQEVRRSPHVSLGVPAGRDQVRTFRTPLWVGAGDPAGSSAPGPVDPRDGARGSTGRVPGTSVLRCWSNHSGNEWTRTITSDSVSTTPSSGSDRPLEILQRSGRGKDHEERVRLRPEGRCRARDTGIERQREPGPDLASDRLAADPRTGDHVQCNDRACQGGEVEDRHEPDRRIVHERPVPAGHGTVRDTGAMRDLAEAGGRALPKGPYDADVERGQLSTRFRERPGEGIARPPVRRPSHERGRPAGRPPRGPAPRAPPISSRRGARGP